MELSFRDTARNLSVAVSTVHSIYKRFQETGDMSPTAPVCEEKRVLTGQQELIITALLWSEPTLYLSEICQKVFRITGIQVSPSTICRVIHKNGLTGKKVQQVALQRSIDYRCDFMAEVQMFDAKQFVWVDETGWDRRDKVRKFGYALRGQRPVYHRLLH